MLEFLKNSGINWAEVIVGIVSIVLTGVIIPLIKSKLDTDKLKKAQFIVREAVQAAEQIFEHGDNDRKYEYVVACLEKAGIKLKKETVEMFIESAVRVMKEFAEISAEIVRADDKSWPYAGIKTQPQKIKTKDRG